MSWAVLTLSSSGPLHTATVLAHPLFSSCQSTTGIEVGTAPATVTTSVFDDTAA